MKAVVALAVLVLAGLMAYVRLAPDDPARWHVPVPQGGAGGALSLLTTPDPAAMLGRVAELASAEPRTIRLAGSVEEGRITWVVRSRIWGFPDYVTAEVAAEGLRLWSRQRYGSRDAGVNAARLKDWVDRLTAG